MKQESNNDRTKKHKLWSGSLETTIVNDSKSRVKRQTGVILNLSHPFRHNHLHYYSVINMHLVFFFFFHPLHTSILPFRLLLESSFVILVTSHLVSKVRVCRNIHSQETHHILFSILFVFGLLNTQDRWIILLFNQAVIGDAIFMLYFSHGCAGGSLCSS